MAKLKRSEYKSETAKQLEDQLKNQLLEDKELALAKAVIQRIPEHRREYVLKLLQLDYVTKGDAIK